MENAAREIDSVQATPAVPKVVSLPIMAKLKMAAKNRGSRLVMGAATMLLIIPMSICLLLVGLLVACIGADLIAANTMGAFLAVGVVALGGAFAWKLRKDSRMPRALAANDRVEGGLRSVGQ